MSEPNPQDFSPRLLAVMHRPPAPLARSVLTILVILVILVIAWAFWGKLDIVARANGKLIPQSRVQVVQPLEGGRIAQILVEEGQLVESGQVLVVMDKSLSEADIEKLKNDKDANDLHLRRINAELSDQSFDRIEGNDEALYINAMQLYQENRQSYAHELAQQEAILAQAKARLASEKELLAKLRETLPIHQANEAAMKKLEKKGYANKMGLLERERERIEVERDLGAQLHTVESLKSSIKESEEKILSIGSAYRQKLLDEKISRELEGRQLAQEISKQQYRNRLLQLKAPQAGFVKDLATHTAGSIIPSGTVLLTVIPADEPLLAEVLVENKDAGFVRGGQKARIKIASYDFQRYGMIDAVVDHVSADSTTSDSKSGQQGSQAGQQQSGYPAILTMAKQALQYNNKTYPVKPGMQISAEINLGSRSVMEYIFSPITKAAKEAGTER